MHLLTFGTWMVQLESIEHDYLRILKSRTYEQG